MPLNYRVVNPKRRCTILFLHGFLGDAEEFHDLGKELERNHTVIYLDLPGHGQSSIDGFDSFHAIGGAIKQIIERHGSRSCHLVGYSMGGRLALYMACRWPSLIQKLTLISVSPGIEDKRERSKRVCADKFLSKKIQQAGMRSFLSYWYRLPLFDTFRNSAQFSFALKRRLTSEPKRVARALEVMSTGAQPSLWEQLSDLKCDIEVICGEADLKYRQIALEMNKRNPRIQVTLVAQVGHVVHLEAEKLIKRRLGHVYC